MTDNHDGGGQRRQRAAQTLRALNTNGIGRAKHPTIGRYFLSQHMAETEAMVITSRHGSTEHDPNAEQDAAEAQHLAACEQKAAERKTNKP